MILYVNKDYGNEVTLDGTMNQDIDNFGDVTWRELIEDLRNEQLSFHVDDLDEWLEESYGISRNELDDKISSAAIDRFYSDLSLYQDNTSGSNADAFELIRSLELFPMDANGNGCNKGVELIQTTANGPRKSVFIEDAEAAQWLITEAEKKGVSLKVEFV